MKIKTREQLEQVRKDCKRLVTKRALAAGVASAIPGAVAGIAADIRLLLKLLPRISKSFGLDPEQIDALDEQAKQQILLLSGSVGSQIIGRVITKEIVLVVMKAVGIRTTIKVAASWVPVIGSSVGGTFGFAAMKYVGNKHVEECYQIISRILNEGDSGAVAA